MEKNGAKPIPTDGEVQQLLYRSRAVADKRAAAATTLILSRRFSTPRLLCLRGCDLDPAGQTVMLCLPRRSPEKIPITTLTIIQLFAIRIRNDETKIFTKRSPQSLPLHLLLRGLLQDAGLGRYVVSDFTRWSQRQAPTTLDMVATIATRW
jgi:hypothetical protein